ncbi:MAG: right-handed parallel beta-helix repeat-containing protein [Planctomycetota bacterium]|nr:right-handed parallel beta-helix repeat-containing protein [Planctomycetota bacterium]
MDLFSLDPPVAKPGGGEFKFWRPQAVFSTTLHVDTQSPRASDANPGTESLPFKTIGRAAEVLRPGQRVLVHAGVYRECIRPVAGGESPSQMIGYHAAPGGQVIVKGSEPAANWTPDDPARGLWVLLLASVDFGDYNPFAIDNLTDASFDIMEWAQPHRGKRPYTLPRGMVFQDGRRLECVGSREELLATDGSHWTDRQAGRLFVRTFGQVDPNAVRMEITTRRGCFRPRVRGLGFIQVCGFVFEQVGNGFPRPQEGAVSVCAGHHWLIEGNTVRDVNAVGIDIGNGWYGGAAQPGEPGEGEPEWTIVRRNRVQRTGVCGIAGLPARNALIEENSLEINSRFPIAEVSESAGIKTHGNQGTLIRRNLIRDNPINGIWMDWDNRDSRCTQNVMIGCGTGIFIEASVVEPFCLLDRNIIWGAKQGIYEHDCCGQTFVHNFIGQSDEGMNIRGKVTDRVIAGNHPAAGGSHTIANNAFFNVPAEINDTTSGDFPPNKVSGNALGAAGMGATLDQDRGILTLTPAEPQAARGGGAGVSHDFLDRPWPEGDQTPGPVPIPGKNPVAVPLVWWREGRK